ncbi:ATP-binding protein [Streptomyces sp. NPDC020490]|uniref:ATP-binding protein n=1 Tax=Streptomyces sp. NPDC020490 TaxID=3365078 RepID=UPI0037A00AAB
MCSTTRLADAPTRRVLAAPTRSYTLRLAHDVTAAASARREARILLASWGLPQEQTDDILLIISELVTNAVEHALPPVALRLRRMGADGGVHIDVSDAGPAASEGARAATGTPAEHGRGRVIIDALSAGHGTRAEAGSVHHWATVGVTA